MNKHKVILNKPLINISDTIVGVRAKVFVYAFDKTFNTQLQKMLNIRFHKVIFANCINDKNFAPYYFQ